jgi:hypothetical protein
MKKSLIIIFLSAITFFGVIMPAFAQQDQSQPSTVTSTVPIDEGQTEETSPQPTIPPQISPPLTEGQATSSATQEPSQNIIIPNTTLELPTEVPPPQSLPLVQATTTPLQKEEKTVKKAKTIAPIFYADSNPATNSNIYLSSRLSPFVSDILLGVAVLLFLVGMGLLYIEKFPKVFETNKATDMQENIFIRLS